MRLCREIDKRCRRKARLFRRLRRNAAWTRCTRVTHQDSNYAQTLYGTAVTGSGGISSQLCSTSTYGFGYPSLTLDEAGKKRQTWTDGFGRSIEADEPDASN